MDVIHPMCCGIDVHNAILAVCLREVQPDGTVRKEERKFGTMHPELVQLADWLRQRGCSVVAMESTGIYWRPVYHVLRTVCEVVIGNPQDIKRRPGKKTDRVDADWIAELLAHGLISPSYIPTPEISALRDLTRTRVQWVNVRTQAKNRIHKTLQDTGIKLACVASDIFGKSGRAMLDALVAGERDPKVLAQLALMRMRQKIPQLEVALDGQFTEHHAILIKLALEQVDMFDRQVSAIDERIGVLMEPLREAVGRLTSIPGVEETAARTILAEIGPDMSRFGSDKRLASWAGVCPSNNESAGKRYSGRTRKGNRWLRRVLVQCAWGTRETSSYLGRTFRRLQARIGGKKAAMAVAHKILVIIYHILLQGTDYQEERYDRLSPRQEEKQRTKALQVLESMGYRVVIETKQVELAAAPQRAAQVVEIQPVVLASEPRQDEVTPKPNRSKASKKAKRVAAASKPPATKKVVTPEKVKGTKKAKLSHSADVTSI